MFLLNFSYGYVWLWYNRTRKLFLLSRAVHIFIVLMFFPLFFPFFFYYFFSMAGSRKCWQNAHKWRMWEWDISSTHPRDIPNRIIPFSFCILFCIIHLWSHILKMDFGCVMPTQQHNHTSDARWLEAQVGSIGMRPPTNDIIEVNLSALLMLLYKLLWLCINFFQLFCGIYSDFISWIHDTQFIIIPGSFCTVSACNNYSKLQKTSAGISYYR